MSSIFEFTDESRIETMWFIGWGGFDIMAVLYQDQKDGPWNLRMRTRLYRSAEAFDGEDIKHVFNKTVENPTEGQVAMAEVLSMGTTTFGAPEVQKVLEIKGNQEDFAKALLVQDFAHTPVEQTNPGLAERVH